MRLKFIRSCGALFAAMFILVFAGVARAETLNDVLTKNGWDALIGTWVDEKSGGDEVTLKYEWKCESTVIETSFSGKMGKSTGLIGLNPSSGEVFSVSANLLGGGSIGKIKFDGADALLESSFVSPKGHQGTVRIQMQLELKDVLVFTIESKQPKIIRFVRRVERDPFAP